MNLMVVDRSGRGASLADAIARTSPGTIVHYVPGCDGLGQHGITTRQSISIQNHAALVDYARTAAIDLVVVANAVALAEGAVDAFRDANIPVVGPDRRAARLESSKVTAKQLFEKYSVPTPEHRSFADPDAAVRFVRDNPEFRVVKADGLCGGNGAFVCDTLADAERAIDRLMRERVFGDAGAEVVIERRVYGRELSFFVILDASGWVTLPMAVDYPKSHDGNQGVISGGMGALSHHPLDTPELVALIERRLLEPISRMIAAERLEYTGFLYLGVMLCDGEPVLLETNVRMGDPEAEVILPRIESDVAALWAATASHRVASQKVRLRDEHLCNVVLTQGPLPVRENGRDVHKPGWPFGPVPTGQVVRGVDDVDRRHCHVFVGEARRGDDGTLRSDGGRVVHVVGRGTALEQARRHAYDGVRHITFDGMRYRTDIGLVMPWDESVTAAG